MSVETWGLLPKSQNDPEYIEDAINRIIEEHNDDPDAHLGVDQSLQSHRASEIIDHRAESVVNDKLKYNARRYSAIVDPLSPSDFSTIQEAIDFTASQGGGTVFIRKGEHQPLDNVVLSWNIDLEGEGFGETIINFNNTEKKIVVRNWTRLGEGGTFYPTYTNGSDIVTCSGVGNFVDAGVQLGFYLNEYETSGQYWEVVEVIDDETVRIASNYTAATGTWETAIGLYATLTGGSPVVTFSNNIDLIALGVRPGCIVWDPYEGENPYTVAEVTSEHELLLSVNYPGTGGLESVWLDFNNTGRSNITGVTVRNTASTALIRSVPAGAPPNLENVNLSVAVVAIIAPGSVSSLNYFGGTISGITGAYMIDTDLSYLEDVNVSYGANNQALHAQTMRSRITECVLDAGAHTGCGIYSTTTYRCSVDNTRTINLSRLTTGTAHVQESRFVSFVREATGSTNFDIDAWQCTFVGGHLYTSGAGRIRLLAASKKCIMIGNWLSFAVTDSGVGNVSTPNVIGT